jgi:hypothetical protein
MTGNLLLSSPKIMYAWLLVTRPRNALVPLEFRTGMLEAGPEVAETGKK